MSGFTTIAICVIGAYLAVGLIVGIAFVVRGVDRVDSAMRGSPASVRVLILPGAAALWPVMLAKWRRAPTSPGAPEAGHA